MLVLRYAHNDAGGHGVVPMHGMHWRPYPVALEQLPDRPDPVDASAIFCGGANMRDRRTLAAALDRDEGPGHPVHRYGPGNIRLRHPDRLVSRGVVPLTTFFTAIARSRFVIVPIDFHRDRAAGLTVVAMALAAGRPVITMLTPGTLDHLRPGEDSLLVPPGDPEALGKAICRLDGDEDLLRVDVRGDNETPLEETGCRRCRGGLLLLFLHLCHLCTRVC